MLWSFKFIPIISKCIVYLYNKCDMLPIYIFISSFNLASVSTIYCDDPTVKLPDGIVKGTFRKSYDGNIFSAFEGIPFAKPPIGNLRFKEPQSANKWNGVLIANKTYTCTQFNKIPYFRRIMGKEDCLYMYVYVPRMQINSNDKFDVIVHIHAGAFMFGSPNFYTNPEFIIDGNIIYVTFNYRVGILGFLSTEDNVVPGNNGLKDQVLALRWIKDNIVHFGGNPDSVTLTGLSSGAESVHYHYLSPMSRGLFHRGFSQSGTALDPISYVRKPLNSAIFVASKLGCLTNSTSEMVNCFKKKGDRELTYWTSKIYKVFYLFPTTPFGPVIELIPNGFLNEHPYMILKQGKIYDVPWITSSVQDEGLACTGIIMAYRSLNIIDQRWNELAPYLLEIHNTVNDDDKTEVVNSIKQHYLGFEHITYKNIRNFTQMFTDRIMMISAEESLRLQVLRNKSPVYYYYYRYLRDLMVPLPTYKNAISHSEDGELLFRFLITPMKLSQNDETMMKSLVDFIVTYAKTGFNTIKWTPLKPNATEIEYLDIISGHLAEMKSRRTLTPNTEIWKNLPIHEYAYLY